MKGDLEAGETIISVKCSEKHAVPVAVIGIFSKIFNYWRLKHDGLVVGYCFLAAHEIPNLDCFASCRGFACISNMDIEKGYYCVTVSGLDWAATRAEDHDLVGRLVLQFVYEDARAHGAIATRGQIGGDVTDNIITHRTPRTLAATSFSMFSRLSSRESRPA